jgi:hypothetical protein
VSREPRPRNLEGVVIYEPAFVQPQLNRMTVRGLEESLADFGVGLPVAAGGQAVCQRGVDGSDADASFGDNDSYRLA